MKFPHYFFIIICKEGSGTFRYTIWPYARKSKPSGWLRDPDLSATTPIFALNQFEHVLRRGFFSGERYISQTPYTNTNPEGQKDETIKA